MPCLFRPCIDLRGGSVVQIVGGTLRDSASSSIEEAVTNFTSKSSAAEFARRYKTDKLIGGHVIMLGNGNEEAARSALSEYRGGLQVGGGVTPINAKELIEAGASSVIVTSYVFSDGKINKQRLAELVECIGKEKLVLDLSCRKRLKRSRKDEGDVTSSIMSTDVVSTLKESESDSVEYVVVTDRWQKWTDCVVDASLLNDLSSYCSEFLVHGVDVEGLRQGVEDSLVSLLGEHSPLPVTYAGGIRNIEDVEKIKKLGKGRVDFTVGSALDLFGGDFKYDDLLQWNDNQKLLNI